MSDTPGYVKNLKKESVVQSVINCLTDAMRNKQLKPGDRIPPEPELCTLLGASRNTLREAIPPIIEAGGGSIVINASDQWFVGKPHSFAYGLTKGALGQITRSLAIDLGPQNIRVNAVCAGTIRTPLVDNLFVKFAEENHCSVEEYWRKENVLYMRGSAGRPEEVAEVVYFLASDASSFCTGSHYLVDGGLVAG